MIAVDTNVLVYAHRGDAPFHHAARALLADLAQGAAMWAIPWPCVHEFLGNVTNPRIYKTPTPLASACAQVAAWLASPSATTLCEGDGYWEHLAALLKASQVVGAKIHDARVAALCLHHGVAELLTADRDFGRFGGLKARNPFAG